MSKITIHLRPVGTGGKPLPTSKNIIDGDDNDGVEWINGPKPRS